MSSQREIKVQEVIDKCKEYLQYRDYMIEKRREKLISEVMSTGWKIFRPKTREEAIKKLNTSDDFSEWNTLEFSGMRWVGEVRRLLTLAQAPNGSGVVLVDSSLANILW